MSKAAASSTPSSWVAKGSLHSLGKIHGGKYYLKKKIISRFCDHKIYTEVFGGMLSVFLGKLPIPGGFEVIHDVNPAFRELYVALRDKPKTLANIINGLEYTRENFEWARTDGARNSHVNEVRAAATLVRSRFSRGGMGDDFAWSDRLRGGRPGDLNAWECFKENLPEIAERFKDVSFSNLQNGWDVMEGFDTPDTLHYCDPPYLPETRTAKQVYEYEMSEEDHLRFLTTCNGLQGHVYISGYRSEMYDDLLPEKRWERVEFDMPNHSGQGEKKQRRIECLWIKRPS